MGAIPGCNEGQGLGDMLNDILLEGEIECVAIVRLGELLTVDD